MEKALNAYEGEAQQICGRAEEAIRKSPEPA